MLITTDSFLPRWDGVARVLSEIIPMLKDKYDLTVIAPRFPGKSPKWRGVKITRIHLSGCEFGGYTPAKYDYKKVAALVKENDIVFNQTIAPIGIAAIKASKKHKIPVISYIHSIEWELFSKAIKYFKQLVYKSSRVFARRMYGKCSLLLIPSANEGRMMRENKIRTQTKIVHL